MAETSLRAYVKEIDDLVEHDQLDEAIAHARHILQTYPRHLDTYRLLGKAYLEAKRYGDAADLFQRVLSAAPEDFVAHVGMSVVREDEGNLDAAIWHMERAFETNPSNAAVQGELRRLIGRRDGLEPHKVRLTRGALARMYAHGELYPQAVAELHTALQEDPDRPDLQVLLADMYWRTNQRAEAAEVASAVIETLPNCMEANRILAAALHSQGRTEEALTYHRRVAALDPYSALVESIQDDPAKVDANAVRIEKLAWRPGQPVGGETGPAGRDSAVRRGSGPLRPSWLDSLGAATATGAAAAAEAPPRDAPRSPAPTPPAPAPVPQKTESPGEASEGEIPQWMQAAGWEPSTGETQEGPVSFSDDELRSLEAGMLPPDPAPESEDGLARADIPEWLKDVAPSDAGSESQETPDQAEAAPTAAAQPSGLGEPKLPAGWSPPAGESDEDDDWLRAAAEDAPALPTWMEEQSPGATATIVTWLGDRSKQEDSKELAPAEEPAETGDAEAAPGQLPEWLADAGPVDDGAPTPPASPGWLSGVAEAAAKGSSIAPDQVQWNDEGPADEGPIETGMYPEEAAEAQPAELPDWLQTIAGRESTTESASQAEPPGGPVPEWLDPGAPARPAAPPSAPEPPGDEGFGWLRELAESEPPTPRSEDDEVPESPAPSWLTGEPASGPGRAGLGRSAVPEWLQGIGEQEPQAGGAAGSDSSSLDWLRGIAEPEAAEEPGMVPEAPLPEPESAAAGAEPVEEADESSEWLNLLSPSDTRPQPGSTGEWLRLLKQDGVPVDTPEGAEGVGATEAPPPIEEMDDSQVFGWLEALAAKQGIPAPESIPPEPTPGLAAPTPPPPAAQKPIPEEPEAGMKWLEDLASAQTPGPEPRPAPAAAPAAPKPQAEAAVARPPAEPSPPAPAEPTPAVEPEPEMQAIEGSARPDEAPTPEAPDWLMELVAVAAQGEGEPGLEAAGEEGGEETLPSLPDWMLATQPADEEPTVPPLPPVAAPSRAAQEPEPAEPIEELADTWVPPWEQLPMEEASPAEESVDPGAALASRFVEEVLEGLESEEAEQEAEVEMPGAEARYVEPTTDVIEEVPEWLRTPAPSMRREEPQPEQPAEESEEELEVPDWLRAPPAPPAAVRPGPEKKPARPAPPPPEPEPLEVEEEEEEPVLEVVAEVEYEDEIEAEFEPVAEVVEAPPKATVKASPRATRAPAAKTARAAKAAPAKAKASDALENRLQDARHALATGDFHRAAKDYGAVVKKKYQLPEVVSELELALDRNPHAADLWQVLGDAYMSSDRLQDAIEAYENGVAAA